ncbi:MAG: hypothetical protein H6713_14780 [Myxococcales bacterium]|nr:hypothetical protein [Myxococcales bacterium]MCB9751238.1 hypothetical protein [Myxococcales bacterium]
MEDDSTRAARAQARVLSGISREELYLLAGAHTPAGREAYAAWLDAAGDPRGEALRLGARLERGHDAAAARRLQDVLKDIDADWWYLINETRIRNCGAAPEDGGPRVRFRFACERSWTELTPTDREDARRCERCAQTVYRCETGVEAARRAQRGECIAVPVGMAQQQVTQGRALYVGRPDYVQIWGDRLFPDGD